MIAGASLREATAMECAAIAHVHVETWRSCYVGLVPDSYLIGMSEEREAVIWRENIGRGRAGSVLVVEHEGSGVVGFGSCGASRYRGMAYAGEIYTLYVLPDWQNRGLGRALVGGLFEELAADGLTSAFLWMLTGNPTRFFYEALGGQVVAERQERFAGTSLDQTAYAWPDLVTWLREARSA